MERLLISLESGEVRNFQDIRDATSARLEITFLDAHAAAYVLNLTNYYESRNCFITLSSIGKHFG
jgi:hypothetical protein